MTKEEQAVHIPYHLILVFFILATGIAIAGKLYNDRQIGHLRDLKRNELSAIADLKVNEISRWREERLRDASLIAGNPYLGDHIEKWIQNPEEQHLKRGILAWIESLSKEHQYEAILLLDPQGTPLLSVPNNAPNDLGTRNNVLESLFARKPLFVDFHRCEATGKIQIEILAPILKSPEPESKVVAVVLLRINPDWFLFPFIQSWPSPSRSSETLIFRREGDEVLFLNDLRYQEGAALTLKRPLSDVQLVSAKTLRGEGGVAEGVDYRGLQVLAAMRKVHGSPWGLVAKVDLDEINGPLQDLSRLILLVVSILISLSAVAIGFIWSRQYSQFYRRQCELEVQKLELSQRYEYLTMYANDIFILSDFEGRIVEANERAFQRYGYSREDFARLYVRDLEISETRPPLDSPRTWQDQETGVVFETVHRGKDGTEFPVEVSSRVIELGGSSYHWSIVRDIRERKQAEKKILRLNGLYAIISRINEAVVRMRDRASLFEETCRIARESGQFPLAWIGIVDKDNKRVIPIAFSGEDEGFWGSEPIPIDGVPEEGSCHETAIGHMKPCVCNDIGGIPSAAPLSERALSLGLQSFASIPILFRGEMYGIFSVYASESHFFGNEETRLLQEISSDISFALEVMHQDTLREKAEKALHKSENKFRTLFDNAGDAFFFHDLHGHFLEVNQVACERLNYSRNELLQMGFSEIEVPRDAVMAPNRLKDLLLRGYMVFEATHCRRDGSSFPVEVSSQIIAYDGAPAVLSIARDVSDRRHLESQLRQLQKMEAIGTLAGGIAHDFNNILGIVFGYTEMALLDSPDGHFRDLLQGVLKAGHRAKDLVKQILTFSRRTEQELKPVQIGLTVKESMKLLRASLPSNIEIRVSVKSTGIVMADVTQIHQIIMNLCTNSYHAMRAAGGILEVVLSDLDVDAEFASRHETLPVGRYLRLSVSDTGHGMSAATRDRIFDPYFTTKAPGEGTGLGLAVVHGIVKSLGGVIEVYSEPGQGAIFHILLPALEHGGGTAPEKPLAHLLTGRERILFVDDEDALASIGQNILKRLGYEVECRTSSRDALELFTKRGDQFDLLITDQNMPGMNGTQLAKECLHIRPDIRIILCTGFSDLISKESSSQLGIREFLMKPLVIEDMARIVRKVLDEKKPQTSV